MSKVVNVLGQIARGGFGRVDRVELDDGTLAARKVFDPSPQLGLQRTELAKARLRFEREINTQRELATHGGFPLLFADTDTDPPWFVMPLALRTYEAQIADDRRNGTITPQPLFDILNSLEELHSLGFVHRDLKPQNVLLHDSTWLLSDFGLAVNPSAGVTTRLTSTASNWGTQLYMAPEQTQEFKKVKPAADIYAFGCILHDLVVGRPRIPFSQHDGPGDVGVIIHKCTHVDATRRFVDVSALRQVLKDALDALGGGNAPPIQRSAEEIEWDEALKDVESWSPSKIADFIAHVAATRPGDMLSAIAGVATPNLTQLGEKLDADEWQAFAMALCAWAWGGFPWDFCDVLVGRLRFILEHPKSDTEVRAEVIVAAAELARSHNRWFVMRAVLKMADPQLDDKVAQRVAIEIRARKLQHNFRRCADELSLGYEQYHPRIAQVLK